MNTKLGDGHDRWRSNALEIGIGNFVFGTNLYNNDPAGEIPARADDATRLNYIDLDGRNIVFNKLNKVFRNIKYGSWKNGQTYSSPLYIGYRSGNSIVRLGYSHRYVQDRTQNWVHRNGFFYLPFGHQNYYNRYDSFYQGVYSYSGYYNPFSLW